MYLAVDTMKIVASNQEILESAKQRELGVCKA